MPLRLTRRGALGVLPFLGTLAGRDAERPRVVAVGDLHGDYCAFVEILRAADLIDAEENWIGGRARLVQTGDVPDRGPDTRRLMDLLIKLERQAEEAGGAVHALIGNHEAMNIVGDLRYVHVGEFASFAGPDSERLLGSAYEEYKGRLRRDPPDKGVPAFDATHRARWFAAHPPGFVEHRRAFSPAGRYGSWILSHDVVVKLDDTLFLHGGISPRYVDMPLDEINQSIRSELRAGGATARGGLTSDPQGPLWYRGLARDPESALRGHVEQVLKFHDVERIVVGHTTTEGAIMPRFDGRVIVIDVGLAAAYGSRRAALLLEDGRALALHRGERIELPSKTTPEAMLPYLEIVAALEPSAAPLRNRARSLDAASDEP